MDTLTLVILTALVNFFFTGLVGGLIVYRFQRKIDDIYAKQMEEFKTSLQKASFEEQTKFVRNQEKMVQTLELIYQKYSVFESNVTSVLYDSIDISNNDNKTFVLQKEFVDATDKFEELDKFFLNNRIYLSKDTSDLISKVFINVRLVTMIPPMIVLLVDSDTKKLQTIRLINTAIAASEADIKRINSKNVNIRKLIIYK